MGATLKSTMEKIATEIVNRAITKENVRRIITMNQVVLLVHVALIALPDAYNYFTGVFDLYRSQYHIFLCHVLALPVLSILLWINKSYEKQNKIGRRMLSFGTLVTLNVVTFLPFIIFYSCTDLIHHGTSSTFVLYIYVLGFVLRLRQRQLILLNIFFSICYFGILVYLGIGYNDNPAIYSDGFSAIVISYFISLGLYKHTKAKVENEILLAEKNENLRVLNEEVIKINEINTRQNKLLEEVNENLSNFAHVAAHDLKAPLRTITSFTGILSRKYREKMTPKDKELQDLITSGCADLSNIIDNLLEFSKVSKGEQLTFQVVDLNELIDKSINLLQQNIEESGTTIYVHEDLPKVKGVRELLQNLFLNLLSNAIKFRKPDHAPTIHINYEIQENELVEISIKDDGIGIEEEYLQEIFQLFRKLNDSSTYEGSGIGLATSKKIIEKHGGRIGVESEYGKGAEFKFTIPLA